VNEIEKRTSWCSSVKYISRRRVFERLTTSFINASNKIAIFLRIDEKNDRNDCVTNRNSKLMSDSDSEDDDEALSRKRSTEIVSWFSFFSIENLHFLSSERCELSSQSRRFSSNKIISRRFQRTVVDFCKESYERERHQNYKNRE
jgi:hypothetical protein